MFKKLLEGASLMYLTAVSDMNVFIGDLETQGHTSKEIIKHLKTSGKSAEISINAMLNDMEHKAT